MKSNALLKLFVFLGFALALAISSKSFAKENKPAAKLKRKPAQQEQQSSFGIAFSEIPAIFEAKAYKELQAKEGRGSALSQIDLAKAMIAAAENTYQCKSKYNANHSSEKNIGTIRAITLAFGCQKKARIYIRLKEIPNTGMFRYDGNSVIPAASKKSAAAPTAAPTAAPAAQPQPTQDEVLMPDHLKEN